MFGECVSVCVSLCVSLCVSKKRCSAYHSACLKASKNLPKIYQNPKERLKERDKGKGPLFGRPYSYVQAHRPGRPRGPPGSRRFALRHGGALHFPRLGAPPNRKKSSIPPCLRTGRRLPDGPSGPSRGACCCSFFALPFAFSVAFRSVHSPAPLPT